MTRILLLTGRSPDFQTRRAVEGLTRGLGANFTVRPDAIGPELHGGVSVVRRIRRGARDVDVLHAFGADALTAAVMGYPGWIAYSPVGFPSRREVGWVRAIGSYRPVEVVCSTVTQHRAFVSGGVPVDRCHVVRPGVDFSRVRRRRDDALRARLNFSPDDFVLLAVGESTAVSAHARAVWAASTLHVLDRRVRLLLWGKGPRAAPAARFAGNLMAGDFTTVATERLGADVAFEALLPATDCVLVTAAGAVPTLPIAIAMAAALPIVSTVTYTTAELLEDRHTALMVTSPSPREIARRVVDLRADPSLQWSIADMARTEAYAYFTLTRFLEQHRTAYRQMANGERVDIPDAAASSGPRFHGR